MMTVDDENRGAERKNVKDTFFHNFSQTWVCD